MSLIAKTGIFYKLKKAPFCALDPKESIGQLGLNPNNVGDQSILIAIQFSTMICFLYTFPMYI